MKIEDCIKKHTFSENRHISGSEKSARVKADKTASVRKKCTSVKHKQTKPRQTL